MKRKGFVSVWVGRGENRRTFNQLLEYRITEDGLGEFEACSFCREYGIGSYDPDLFGGRFFPKKIGFKLLFHETTFALEVASACANACVAPANCYVLLHDYQYDGKQKDVELAGFSFSFVGVFQY